MAKDFNYLEYVKNLPDAYRKDKDSNNYKILETEKHSIEIFQADTVEVYDSLDIWKAKGYTLDLYGEIYQIPRNGMDDDTYRLKILLKIIEIKAGSDHTSIIKTLSATLGIPIEIFNIVDSEISGNIDVEFPYSIFQEAGVSPKEVYDAIKMLLGAAIGVDKFNLLHELPESKLLIATAMTVAERFTVEIKPIWYEDVQTILDPAIVTMQHEINEVEVI